jgi:hypothetical protein
LDYLPSKKFIKTLGSAMIILLVGFFVVRIWGAVFPNNSPIAGFEDAPTNYQEILSYANEDANADTDEDGLKNWEETLWKTDLKNPDTDNDGTTDGEEIKEGRDPTITGPGDELKKLEDIYVDGTNENSEQTLSAKMADDFATAYFSYKATTDGAPLTNQEKENIKNSVLLNVEKSSAAYNDVYTKENIVVINSSSAEDAKKYINTLGQALDNNFKNISGSELEILNLIMDSSNQDNIALFDPYLTAYEKFVGLMQTTPVPNSYAELHLSLLNSMQNTFFAVRNMQQFYNDASTALVGTKLYYRELSRARNFLENLKKQTESDGLVFAKEDAGSFFNKYFEQI